MSKGRQERKLTAEAQRTQSEDIDEQGSQEKTFRRSFFTSKEGMKAGENPKQRQERKALGDSFYL